MALQFIKMHSLGNDFMMVNGVDTPIHFSEDEIRHLADRHRGIGFDQCLVLEKPTTPEDDFSVRIYNADGSEVGQCGNGMRCLARFIAHLHVSPKKTLRVATKTTSLQLVLHEDETVTVIFPPPKIKPQKISLHAYTLWVLDVGNPHAVMKVSKLETCDVATIGKQLSEDPFFPEQTNVEFLTLSQANEIKLRVYERGCGETKACGSGAVAAAIVAHQIDSVALPMKVVLPGGTVVF